MEEKRDNVKLSFWLQEHTEVGLCFKPAESFVLGALKSNILPAYYGSLQKDSAFRKLILTNASELYYYKTNFTFNHITSLSIENQVLRLNQYVKKPHDWSDLEVDQFKLKNEDLFSLGYNFGECFPGF